MLASGGSLKESVVVRSISASLELVSSSQLSIQPLLSSQNRASLAEDTGLGVAVTWASKSGRERDFGRFVMTWNFDYYWCRVMGLEVRFSASIRHS